MISSQLLKGSLEGCILQIISKEDSYGYDILQKLKSVGFTELNEGTVYLILLRLQKNGCLTTYKTESPIGPGRKYYKITPKGEVQLETFICDWRELSSAVSDLFDWD